ncbi:hypothetical protein YC2023_103083 [Brassica napus]
MHKEGTIFWMWTTLIVSDVLENLSLTLMKCVKFLREIQASQSFSYMNMDINF